MKSINYEAYGRLSSRAAMRAFIAYASEVAGYPVPEKEVRRGEWDELLAECSLAALLAQNAREAARNRAHSINMEAQIERNIASGHWPADYWLTGDGCSEIEIFRRGKFGEQGELSWEEIVDLAVERCGGKDDSLAFSKDPFIQLGLRRCRLSILLHETSWVVSRKADGEDHWTAMEAYKSPAEAVAGMLRLWTEIRTF